MFKLFSKRSKYSVLASALVAATPFTSLSPVAQAGIMVDTYEQLLYGDIAEGKGIFAPGKTNIQIYDTDGKLRGSIPYSVDPQGIADEFFLTLIHPQFGISAYHVGYTTDITFGNTKILVRNDGTLFEKSGAVKAFNGNSIDDTKEWSRLLSGNKKQWREIFVKYLSTNYREANNDRMIWYKKDFATDFKIDRYTKLIVDAIPYEGMSNDDIMKPGDRLLHIGAGTAQMHSRANAADKKYYTYATPIGGLGIVTWAGDANVHQKQTNPQDTTKDPNHVLVGFAFQWNFSKVQKPTDVLEQGILGGDSGSPIFWLDPKSNTWKLAGATSSITGYTFGATTNFIGNLPWAVERTKFYDAPPITVKEGETVVFHGQNSMNGRGNIHLVAQGATDTLDNNLQADTDRVALVVEKDIENNKYIIDEKNARRKPAAQKPGLVLGTEEEYKNSTYQNTYQVSYVEYNGYAFGYDFSKFGKPNGNVNAQIAGKNFVLNKEAKSLTFNGAGQGKQTVITFADDVAVSKNQIHLGAGSITLNNGDFVIQQNSNSDTSKHVKSFINAGYIVNADASLTFKLDGQADDAIHKLGQGTLRIAGKGNQLSPLNVGQGLIELNREDGYATPYLKIASGRAIIKLMRDNQLVRNLDNQANNVAVGFGQNGGILDFNGYDKDQTWIDIYHLDAGATLANLATGAENKVTFTFNPTGKRSYLGSFVGNLDIVYKPQDTSSTDKSTWMLKNTVDTSGDFRVSEKANLVLGDVRVQRGWGQYYADRFERVRFFTGTTTLDAGSSLSIGRYTHFSSDIQAGDNTTITIHNRDKFVAPNDVYPIENQAQVEKTILDGSLTLTNSARAIVDVDAGHVVDIFSDIRGTGTLTLTGKGVINLGGNNSFAGAVKVCDDTSADANCTTPLNFVTQVGEEYIFDPLAAPELSSDFAQAQKVTQAAPTASASAQDTTVNTSASTPTYASADLNLASDAFTQYHAGVTLANADSQDVGNAVTTTTPASTTSTTKPTIEQLEYDKHQQWSNKEMTEAEQAEQSYQHQAQDATLKLVPVPATDSLVLNFFSKEALFKNASLVDTNNAKVVFYTNFVDASAGEQVTWDLGNYTGDAFIIKDDKSQLQLKNHNLTGTLFVKDGSLVADHISSHLILGNNAVFYADARNDVHKVTLHGRVINGGTIYLTQKDTLLPNSATLSNKPVTIAPPSISLPSVSAGESNDVSSVENANSPTSSETTPSSEAGSGVTLAGYLAGTTPSYATSLTLADDLANLATTPASDAANSNANAAPSASANSKDPATSATSTPTFSILEINGDYFGDNGKFVYDMNQEAYQVHIKGNAGGTTQLVISDISSAAAAAHDSFDLLVADGNIQQDAFTISNGFVSGGLYDYVGKAAGNKFRLISYIAPDAVVVPSVSFGDAPPPTTEALPFLDPDLVPITSTGPAEIPTVPELPFLDINKVPITSTGPVEVPTVPELPYLDPNQVPITSTGPVEVPTAPELPYLDPNEVPITSTGNPEVPTVQPAPELETSKVIISSTGSSEVPTTPVLPELDASKVGISRVENLTTPALPTFTGARIINSSVGTLLANRRFISNLNVNPLDLTARPGFYLDVDRDSESLLFQGANYNSSYAAKRTLVGNNFQVGKQSNVGIFASTAHANSTITNMVNSATGEVKAYGLGVTAGTQLGSFELAGSAQYVYADNNVTGTHNQHETLHGGFVAAQVAFNLPTIGDNINYFTLKPYVLLQGEFTPTSHFVSRLGEELGTVMAHRYTQATGIKVATHLNKLALEVDAYKNLGQRTTKFNSYYTADHIVAMNNNFRVKTTLSYQLLPSVKVSTYFNTQGSHSTSGVSLDVKW